MADDWRAVGRRIAIERARRWPNRADFADVTGLSVSVLEQLESGRRKRYAPDTLARIEQALRWEPGTCWDIADGRPVRYVLDAELRAIHDAWPHLHRRDRRMLADLADWQRAHR